MSTVKQSVQFGRVVQILMLVIVLPLAILAGGAYFLMKPMDSMSSCEETITDSVPSPDGRFIATAFLRNCGATAPFVAHVNLREGKTKVAPNSNGVIDDGEIWKAKGQQSIALKWGSPNELVINVAKAGNDRSESAKEHWGTLSIQVNHTQGGNASPM